MYMRDGIEELTPFSMYLATHSSLAFWGRLLFLGGGRGERVLPS